LSSCGTSREMASTMMAQSARRLLCNPGPQRKPNLVLARYYGRRGKRPVTMRFAWARAPIRTRPEPAQFIGSTNPRSPDRADRAPNPPQSFRWDKSDGRDCLWSRRKQMPRGRLRSPHWRGWPWWQEGSPLPSGRPRWRPGFQSDRRNARQNYRATSAVPCAVARRISRNKNDLDLFGKTRRPFLQGGSDIPHLERTLIGAIRISEKEESDVSLGPRP